MLRPCIEETFINEWISHSHPPARSPSPPRGCAKQNSISCLTDKSSEPSPHATAKRPCVLSLSLLTSPLDQSSLDFPHIKSYPAVTQTTLGKKSLSDQSAFTLRSVYNRNYPLSPRAVSTPTTPLKTPATPTPTPTPTPTRLDATSSEPIIIINTRPSSPLGGAPHMIIMRPGQSRIIAPIPAFRKKPN